MNLQQLLAQIREAQDAGLTTGGGLMGSDTHSGAVEGGIELPGGVLIHLRLEAGRLTAGIDPAALVEVESIPAAIQHVLTN